MSAEAAVPPARSTAPLFGAAMVIFLITVGIGVLNGLDLMQFDRNTLLTHVHAGGSSIQGRCPPGTVSIVAFAKKRLGRCRQCCFGAEASTSSHSSRR